MAISMARDYIPTYISATYYGKASLMCSAAGVLKVVRTRLSVQHRFGNSPRSSWTSHSRYVYWGYRFTVVSLSIFTRNRTAARLLEGSNHDARRTGNNRSYFGTKQGNFGCYWPRRLQLYIRCARPEWEAERAEPGIHINVPGADRECSWFLDAHQVRRTRPANLRKHKLSFCPFTEYEAQIGVRSLILLVARQQQHKPLLGA